MASSAQMVWDSITALSAKSLQWFFFIAAILDHEGGSHVPAQHLISHHSATCSKKFTCGWNRRTSPCTSPNGTQPTKKITKKVTFSCPKMFVSTLHWFAWWVNIRSSWRPIQVTHLHGSHLVLVNPSHYMAGSFLKFKVHHFIFVLVHLFLLAESGNMAALQLQDGDMLVFWRWNTVSIWPDFKSNKYLNPVSC